MIKTNIEIEIPFVRQFEDYHEIDHLADDLCNFDKEGRKTKGVEVGFDGSCYWGLFYMGKRPAKSVIRSMLVDQDVDMNDFEFCGNI